MQTKITPFLIKNLFKKNIVKKIVFLCFLKLFLAIFKKEKEYLIVEVLICVIYRQIQQDTGCKKYIHYVNCIYIDSDTNYFMILIMYKSPKLFTQRAVYQEVHSNYELHCT